MHHSLSGIRLLGKADRPKSKDPPCRMFSYTEHLPPLREEICQVPDRLEKDPFPCVVIAPDGTQYPIWFRRHFSTKGGISEHYGKAMPYFLSHGAARKGLLGSAETYAAGAAEMFSLLEPLLRQDPQLFCDERPMPR